MLVLFRKGMFEAYIDGLLVQSFVCADPATSPLFRVLDYDLTQAACADGGVYPLPSQGHGRVGIACSGAVTVEAEGASLWQMSL